MKRFCSQCGKELEKKILICPKCGYKNKNKNKKKRLLISLIILVSFVTLGGFVYILRNQILTIIGNPLNMIARLQDQDYNTKEKYKETYERYLLELDVFISSMAYSINIENAKDFDAKGYQLDGDISQTVKDLLILRDAKLEEMNNNNCFLQININDYCDNLLNDVKNINHSIWIKVDNKTTEYRFCGSDNYDHFVPTCKAALEWNYLYWESNCQKCNDKVQELLTIASSAKDLALTEDLLTLTTALDQYNQSVLEKVKIVRQSHQDQIPIAFNRDRIRLVESLSNTELKREYAKEEYAIEKSFLGGKPLTKNNLTEHYYTIMNSLYDGLNETQEKLNAYSETIEMQEKDITSYISILNGAYSLNLSKPY